MIRQFFLKIKFWICEYYEYWILWSLLFIFVRKRNNVLLPMDKLNSSNEGNIAKVKSRILACFSYTTAHGYGRVATAIGESRLRKWFWLLACAAAYGVFTYQLMDLASQYLSKPLKTRASIAHEQVSWVTNFSLTGVEILARNAHWYLYFLFIVLNLSYNDSDIL